MARVTMAPEPGDAAGVAHRASLRALPLFTELSDADLDRLYSMSRVFFVPADHTLIEEGSPGDALYIILDGEIEITKRGAERQVVVAERGAGEFIGEMSLFQEGPRTASVRTLKKTHVLVVSRSSFEDLLASSPSAAMIILRTMVKRLRSTESLLMQQEKMAALGTFAAGLAHELNNPASAIQRGSAQLREALATWERSTAELGRLGLGREQTAAIWAIFSELLERNSGWEPEDPLSAAEREEQLQDWLESGSCERPWELASVLMSAGVTRADMESLARRLPDAPMALIVPWLAAAAEVQVLLREIGQSAAAIAEIVAAVRAYSHLDQAPIKEIDVHASLDSTLLILRNKLKQGVKVVREYARDLPRIEAYPGELNQVWTNLIDNAVGAMEGRGTLTLSTSGSQSEVAVEVTDTGGGIDPAVQPRIFEPFFTTKAPGMGTGLGLHIAHNIIQRHHGQISVTSRPGETRFRVRLPVRLPCEE